jgi:cell wall-associated NlpC family hydrolase
MNLSNITARFIGVPYKLGSMDRKEGLDCFSLVVNYLREIGYDIDNETTFKGFDFSNYGKAFEEYPKILNVGLEWLSGFLEEVPPNGAVASDIIFAQLKSNVPAFGIEAGNGYMITVTVEQGVTAINKKYYTIERVFRCRK